MRSLSKKSGHCTALDGVRGLSALFVLLFHVGHWLEIRGLAVNGGLSVDTFFTLSGYVLARAYSQRVDVVSNVDFLLQRLVRLMPVIALSLIIGASYVVLRNYVMTGDFHASEVLIALLLGLANIPYFYAPVQIGGPQIFPLNGPQFSLFFEIVANVFWWATRYANQLYFSVTIYIFASIMIVWAGIGGDQTDNFVEGFYHVGSSFFAGVFCYHIGGRVVGRIDLQLTFYGLLLAMIVIFSMPYELDFGARILWKLLLAPLLVISGAAVTLPKAAERSAVFIGDLSYPVYALHYPVFCWLNGMYQKLHGGKSAGVEAVLFVMLTIITSYLALRYYDEPIRRRLASLLPPDRRRDASGVLGRAT